MDFLDVFMPTVWFVILALFLSLYVILDGFDLGVGILSEFVANRAASRRPFRFVR